MWRDMLITVTVNDPQSVGDFHASVKPRETLKTTLTLISNTTGYAGHKCYLNYSRFVNLDLARTPQVSYTENSAFNHNYISKKNINQYVSQLLSCLPDKRNP